MIASRYEIAHPESAIGRDLDAAFRLGLRLVAIKPDGLLILRRKRWWEFWL